MAGEFLSIPGNIKQIYLPFVLDPTNAINTQPIDVVDSNGKQLQNVLTTGRTLFFSFKKSSVSANSSNSSTGLIKIFPDSFLKVASMHNDDLSYKLLYDRQTGNTGKDNKQQIDFLYSILNNIPTVQIREYLQDAKLDLMFLLFSAFLTGLNIGANAATNPSLLHLTLWKKVKTLFSQMPDILKKTFNLVLLTYASAYLSLTGKNTEAFDDFILKIPYILYYKLIGATTTNIYEIPYNGKFIDTSDGNNGWNTKRGLAGIDTSANSMLGALVNYFGKNIRVNTTPTWDGADATTPIEIKIDFDLYNDSYSPGSDESAMMNFILVNTLVPGNKWLQYHIFLHSPNLYDVYLAGVNRFFMCSGKFDVEGKGVLRRPSYLFIYDLNLKYTNKGYKFNIHDSDIKIPDIYECHLTFTSLLPNNYNNFLYRYYNNTLMKTLTGKDVHTTGVMAETAQQLAQLIQQAFTDSNYMNVDATGSMPGNTVIINEAEMQNGQTKVTT